jgi:hypothetical protein
VSRDWRLYWDDIIEACEKVLRYTAGMDRDAFAADEKTRDAVLRNLEIIGEAASTCRRKPASLRALSNGRRFAAFGIISPTPILAWMRTSCGA